MLIPVILSGGAGTRLWPVSRQSFPKPFIELEDGETLLEKAWQRAARLPDVGDVLTVSNRDYYFHSRDLAAKCREQSLTSPKFAEHLKFHWLLEPEARNTAPAILLAAHYVAAQFGEDACCLVLPADHLIQDWAKFAACCERAQALAQQGKIVTFGIEPTRAETGFGYILRGNALGEDGFLVEQFIEKPNRERAESMWQSGRYFWNAGMFCFQAGTLLQIAQALQPELARAAQTCFAASEQTGDAYLFDPKSFAHLTAESFDVAMMERTNAAAMVTANFAWSDIGSWAAMAEIYAQELDAAGNFAQGEAILLQTKNSFIRSSSRLVATVGVDNLCVIDTPDALLIAHRDATQAVRDVVAQLKASHHPAHDTHQTVYRPWGSYTVLEQGARFKIKRIIVHPGHSLSRQMHYHRNEHWVVVSGTARIEHGENTQLLLTNQSTYIEAGTVHRLENPGQVDLVMIEVQSGEYLGEDDIVRFEDQYGRG